MRAAPISFLAPAAIILLIAGCQKASGDNAEKMEVVTERVIKVQSFQLANPAPFSNQIIEVVTNIVFDARAGKYYIDTNNRATLPLDWAGCKVPEFGWRNFYIGQDGDETPKLDGRPLIVAWQMQEAVVLRGRIVKDRKEQWTFKLISGIYVYGPSHGSRPQLC